MQTDKCRAGYKQPEVISGESLDAVALKLAKRCRSVVQACLREEEWLDADQAFFDIIRHGIGGLFSRTA